MYFCTFISVELKLKQGKTHERISKRTNSRKSFWVKFGIYHSIDCILV